MVIARVVRARPDRLVMREVGLILGVDRVVMDEAQRDV